MGEGWIYNPYLSKNALSSTFLHIKSKNSSLAFFLVHCQIIVSSNFFPVFGSNIHICFTFEKTSSSRISARI
ncbi:MAG: hypothetical protein LBC61_01230 [Candidatus Peribacteria bacterium]|nr:hypothetical protein [Candidatus Peribacteria bacterium]